MNGRLDTLKCWLLAIIAFLLMGILWRMPKDGTTQLVRVDGGSIAVSNTVPVEVQNTVTVESE